jgi:hypothetical protein
MFAAAVSVAGYDAPIHDATTGNLFGRQPQLARNFSPSWLLGHEADGQPALLAIATRTDSYSYRASLRLAAVERAPGQLAELTLPSGGHNFATFASELPTGLGWLSEHVAGPLAPVPTVDGQAVRPVPYRPFPPDSTRKSALTPPRHPSA